MIFSNRQATKSAKNICVTPSFLGDLAVKLVPYTCKEGTACEH
jgi:hypothetical protein